MTDRDVFHALLNHLSDEALIVANGYLSRQAFACRDRQMTFYMLGSMGLASSIGLGVALSRPERRVVVVDGDGNLLMSLGALAMIGNSQPSNLVHLLLDNEMYASTGGQRSVSASVAMTELALAAGYRNGVSVRDEASLQTAIKDTWARPGPSFIVAKVNPEDVIGPRVTRSPSEITRSFKKSVASGNAPS
jgi:thiamine pyrophosphate-dependent acetolactate synthase large subunit-like protein